MTQHFGEGLVDLDEKYYIEHFKPTYPGRPVLFDIGAAQGVFTDAVRATTWGADAQCYLFEPVPKHLDFMYPKYEGFPNVEVFPIAIADFNGPSTLYVEPANVEHSSLAAPGKNSELCTVDVRSIDSFCDEMEIRHIDYLKIDVEGWEYRALQGAAEMFAEGRVTVVQFELGWCRVEWVRKIWRALVKHGYEVSLYDLYQGPKMIGPISARYAIARSRYDRVNYLAWQDPEAFTR